MQPSIPPGRVFGRYRIVRLIGAGGMGSVYEARHIELDRRVALKTMRRKLAADATALRRFVQEGKAIAKIEHPHVVAISDVGSEDGTPYLVMEYLEGESLSARLAREGKLAPAAALDVLLPIVSAVHAAHERGIIHRDLKPENIFLVKTPHGVPHPKVVDFGISKLDDGEPAATGSGVLLGTPGYLSPEQARNSKSVGRASDQFVLGVILYECVTGKRAFKAESLYELLSAIVDGRFTAPREHAPELSADLEEVVLRAMASRPEDRFPSLLELGRALLPFASSRAASTWGPAFSGAAPSGAPPPAANTESAPRDAPPDRSAPETLVTVETRSEPAVVVRAPAETQDGTAPRGDLVEPPPVEPATPPLATDATAPKARGRAGVFLALAGAIALAAIVAWRLLPGPAAAPRATPEPAATTEVTASTSAPTEVPPPSLSPAPSPPEATASSAPTASSTTTASSRSQPVVRASATPTASATRATGTASASASASARRYHIE